MNEAAQVRRQVWLLLLAVVALYGLLRMLFHRLTGKRLKHMPFTPARVQEALKA